MRALSLSLVIVVVSAGAALAQDRKAAEKAFNDAQKHYDAGEYKEAVKGFLTAYQLVPVNPLLFNIGQAYRLSGEPDKALSYYEKYVAFEPNGAQVSEAKDHIQKLKEDIETQRRETARDQADREREQQLAQARAEEQRKRQEEAERARQRSAETAGSGLRTGGLVVAGVGVVAAGVGIGLLVGSDGSKTAPAALIGVGGAAIVAGTTMYLLGRKKRSDATKASSSAMLVPQITSDTLGVAWITSF
jgi:tetratricopeptide (TPR) repeat protein